MRNAVGAVADGSLGVADKAQSQFVSTKNTDEKPAQKVWVYNGKGVAPFPSQVVVSLFQEYGHEVNTTKLMNLEFNLGDGDDNEKFSKRDLFILPGGNACQITEKYNQEFYESGSSFCLQASRNGWPRRKSFRSDALAVLRYGHGLGICAGGILLGEDINLVCSSAYKGGLVENMGSCFDRDMYLGLMPMLSYAPYGFKVWPKRVPCYDRPEVQQIVAGESAEAFHVYTHSSPAFVPLFSSNHTGIQTVVAQYKSVMKLSDAQSGESTTLNEPAAVIVNQSESGLNQVAVGYHPEANEDFFSYCEGKKLMQKGELESARRSYDSHQRFFKQLMLSTVLDSIVASDYKSPCNRS